jgi:hypothetical protein
MSDAEFRALFARLDQSAEPRPESVERLLGEIDEVIGSPGAAGGADAGSEEGQVREQQDRELFASARPGGRRLLAMGVLVAVAALVVATVAVVVTRPGAHGTSVVVTRPGTHQPKPAAPTSVPPPLPPPSGRLYWLNGAGIGRANLDGTGEVDLIPLGGGTTCGLTVDRNYVYWTDVVSGTVARAKHDGTGIQRGFIGGNGPPPTTVCLAVDDAHLYWTTSASIGRANLDGTGVEESFIPGVNAGPNPYGVPACGVAVDRTHIYWANGATGTIGRANLDGTGANQDFIDTGLGASGVCGVFVDGAHIYWGTNSVSPSNPNPAPPVPDGTVGRANLDGTGVDNTFISRPGVPFPIPCGEDGVYLYWASGGTPGASRNIGRARLDGTDVQPDFLTGHAGNLAGPGCGIGP